MSPTILIVEDELLIAMDIKGILAEEGYNAIINVVTVEHAIQIIEEQSPVLVLIDINLKQDKDGTDLGQYLLEKDRIPYIYITSYADKITMDKVKDTRPYGYIVKPFKPIDIKTTVSVVLSNYKHRFIDIVRAETPMKDDVPFIIKETINYINKNVSEKLEIADLAKITRWKESHFIRVFKKYAGMTPYQYILKRKIEKAKTLLVETTLPIVEISFELGFLSHSNFCIAFKKYSGMTPEEFRKINQIQKHL